MKSLQRKRVIRRGRFISYRTIQTVYVNGLSYRYRAYLLNSMTKDTYSAIPNRGIQPIINQLRGYKKKIKKDGKVVAEKWIPSILVSDPEATKYCLKLDVRKYYPSIVHDVLKAKYRELFKDEELIWLMDEIIDSISTCPATEENIEILRGRCGGKYYHRR